MDLVSGFRFVLALVVVIGLIAALAWLLRKYGSGRVTLGGGKGRLAVVEAAHIDAKRRLVLIRRDDVEHLILLAPNSETVVETGITGATNFAAELSAQSGGPTDAPSGTSNGPAS